jgi:hypothetical protein
MQEYDATTSHTSSPRSFQALSALLFLSDADAESCLTNPKVLQPSSRAHADQTTIHQERSWEALLLAASARLPIAQALWQTSVRFLRSGLATHHEGSRFFLNAGGPAAHMGSQAGMSSIFVPGRVLSGSSFHAVTLLL